MNSILVNSTNTSLELRALIKICVSPSHPGEGNDDACAASLEREVCVVHFLKHLNKVNIRLVTFLVPTKIVCSDYAVD